MVMTLERRSIRVFWNNLKHKFQQGLSRMSEYAQYRVLVLVAFRESYRSDERLQGSVECFGSLHETLFF